MQQVQYHPAPSRQVAGGGGQSPFRSFLSGFQTGQQLSHMLKDVFDWESEQERKDRERADELFMMPGKSLENVLELGRLNKDLATLSLQLEGQYHQVEGMQADARKRYNEEERKHLFKAAYDGYNRAGQNRAARLRALGDMIVLDRETTLGVLQLRRVLNELDVERLEAGQKYVRLAVDQVSRLQDVKDPTRREAVYNNILTTLKTVYGLDEEFVQGFDADTRPWLENTEGDDATGLFAENAKLGAWIDGMSRIHDTMKSVERDKLEEDLAEQARKDFEARTKRLGVQQRALSTLAEAETDLEGGLTPRTRAALEKMGGVEPQDRLSPDDDLFPGSPGSTVAGANARNQGQTGGTPAAQPEAKPAPETTETAPTPQDSSPFQTMETTAAALNRPQVSLSKNNVHVNGKKVKIANQLSKKQKAQILAFIRGRGGDVAVRQISDGRYFLEYTQEPTQEGSPRVRIPVILEEE